MFLNVTYLDEDPTPYVYSIPPSTSPDGSARQPQIVLEPFGPDKDALFDEDAQPADIPAPQKGSVNLILSIDEAEDLARRLVLVVQAAKQGVFSTMGEELKRFTREKRLQEAWNALMNEDGGPTEGK